MTAATDILRDSDRAGRLSWSADACAKAILCGEHAVVFGRPAVALPIGFLRARAFISAGNRAGRGILVEAPDIGRTGFPDEDPALKPLAAPVAFAFASAGKQAPALTLRIESSIPPSRGLGSGAAVAVCAARAAASAAGIEIEPNAVSAAAFEAEKIHHGNPSGIDNTVIAFERAVRFSASEGMRFIDVKTFDFVLSQTGSRRPTFEMVGFVREFAERDPAAANACFDAIARETDEVERSLGSGDRFGLGGSMNRVHALLRGLSVSCLELDRLVDAAMRAGALGAKLCGAGGGGFMIALSPSRDCAERIATALNRAGGRDTFACTTRATG